MSIEPITDPILLAKITPPETGRVFVRPALFEKLAEFTETPRKVWVSSPGGSGKTTLVRSFLAGDSRPIIWYHVDHSDQDPANLFFCLARAVPGLETDPQSLPQLMPEYLPNLTVYCRNYFRALFAKFEAGCVLVFDNLQDGPGESLFGPVLAAILAELPGNSALFILSREEPYPQFARERLNRSLAYLGWDDLRLSIEETRRFLSWSVEVEPLPRTLDRAYDLTHGWLAGLLLFLDNPKEALLPQKLSFDRIELLFDYFTGEIFARLPSETQGFLIVCSFLPTIDISIAAALSGRPDAGEILRNLVRENHFTFRISSNPEVYLFHPLFRQFLLSRAGQLIDSQRLAEIQEQAAGLLLAAEQIEAAADLLIQARAWSDLAELITAQAELLLKQGRSLTLLQWLDALPESRRSSDPWLSYWFGCCLLAQNPLSARLEFVSAFEQFEREGDISGCMYAWVRVVNAIIIGWNDFGELDQWIDRFNLLLERHVNFPSSEIEALMVQGICRTLIWRQPANKDLPRWAERLYQLVTTSSDSTFRILAGSNLAFYHTVSGELTTAQTLVTLLNSDLHSAQVTPLEKLTWLATRAVLECVLLDRQGCLATVEAGREIIEESGVHAMDLRLFSQGITVGLCTGDLSLARQLLDELPTTPILAALDHSYFCYLLADFKLLQGELAEAIALAELAHSRAKDAGGVIPIAFSLAGLTMALYEDGQLDRVAELIEEGLKITPGVNYFNSHFNLLAAFFALEKKDVNRARDLLREGFGLAARQGYRLFHPWRDEIMTRLCREAISAGIEVDYVNRLVSCHNLDIAHSDAPNLTPKEIEILNWVKEGKTTWEIARIQEISERTVKFHISNILSKLEVNSRFQAVAIAMKTGILSQD
jgi:LuxR family transcriptional regulator, maltose regulon positive regulatory protein